MSSSPYIAALKEIKTISSETVQNLIQKGINDFPGQIRLRLETYYKKSHSEVMASELSDDEIMAIFTYLVEDEIGEKVRNANSSAPLFMKLVEDGLEKLRKLDNNDESSSSSQHQQDLICSFIFDDESNMKPFKDEVVRDYFTSTFLNDEKIVLKLSEMCNFKLFSTTTMENPNLLGLPHQHCLVYKIKNGKKHLRGVDVSPFTVRVFPPTSAASSTTVVIPPNTTATKSTLLQVDKALLIANKKCIVTLSAFTTTSHEKCDTDFVDFFPPSSLLLSKQSTKKITIDNEDRQLAEKLAVSDLWNTVSTVFPSLMKEYLVPFCNQLKAAGYTHHPLEKYDDYRQEVRVFNLNTLLFPAYASDDRVMNKLTPALDPINTVIIGTGGKISTAGLIHIANTLPNLTSLNLHNCTQFDNSAIVAISDSPLKKSLRHLDLSAFIDTISDHGAQAIAKFENLDSLNLSECGITTDRFLLIAQGASATKIETLYVSGSSRLTEQVFEQTIPESFTNLTFLDVTGSKNLKGDGLNKILGECKKLKQLRVKYCDNVKQKVADAQTKFPHVKILTSYQ